MSDLLVGLDDLPDWLRGLARASATVPGEQISRFVPPEDLELRRGSVLMLLGEGPAGPEVLLIERASTLRNHAGQPAFPGGAVDAGEDAITAALREGWEETGLDVAGVVPVVVLPELWLPVSDFRVTPVLAWWRQPTPVAPVDPGEVAHVFTVPLAELADPANRFMVSNSSGWIGPAFSVQGIVVWGFTAGLLTALLELGGWAVPYDTTDVRPVPIPAPGATGG